jgi:hypothetical protein
MLLAVDSNVDERAVWILRNAGIEIAEDAPQSVVITDEMVMPVRIVLAEAQDLDLRDRRDQDDDRLFVINAILDAATAARLEDANISYVDAVGHRWLRSWARTRRSRESGTAAKGRRRLYAASVRLAQLLADHPQELWTERGLAGRGQTTQTTAHRLLGRLETEGMLTRKGRGPSTQRWVRDPRSMRSWLAREGRPRKVARLSCFVESPERVGLPGRTLALTGAAAAEAIGMPVLTRLSIATMRVGVRPEELEDVPEALGGFRTEQGANLVLIADPDRLGLIDATAGPDGRLLAPPSRIMLDLFLEPRGEAAADVFLGLWGDREVSL